MLYERNGNGIQKEGWGRDGQIMVESTMEIKVPITVKGGREGDKVGKQIGDKIANALNKSLKSAGFGGSKSSASASGGGSQASGFLGLSKGMGAVVAKLSVIGLIAGAALGLMKKSSGYLRGVLSVFGRAFLIFFRPFGDFLASLLRPLAIMLMKMAVAFLKFTRTGIGKKAVGTALGAGGGALAGAAIGALGGPIGAAAGALIGAGLALLAQIDWKAVYDKMLQFGGWLWDNIKKIWDWKNDFNVWLWDKIKSVWSWHWDFGSWLWGKLMTVWNYVMDFGSWLWGVLVSVWNYTMDFGSWLWGKIKLVWNYVADFGGWLWGKVKSIWSWRWDFGGWLWKKVKSIWSWGSSSNDDSRGYATGTNFVGETGMYKLHRGESVIPRVQNNNSSNASSIILKPTIQMNGNSSNVDPDELARRFSNITMMELKSRGIA